jgi:hypothetical protein
MKGEVVQCATPSRSFVTRHLGGETLIVPVTGGVADLECIYVLNPVGARIWQLLATPTTPERIAAAIVREFDVTADEAAQDVSEFLASLQTRGLIEEPGDSRQP